MGYYGIDDGNGNQVSTGLTERDAYRVAQERANERNEPMFVYEVGSDADATRVDPETDAPQA